jgi:deoxyribose-phosphate aldolase
MLEAVRDWRDLTGEMVGVKPAGGIKTSKDAIKFLVTVSEIAGDDWLDNQWFRFGASSLLNDLLLQRQRMTTGAYSGASYIADDSPSTAY